jgi:type III secretion protein U
VSGEKTEKPTAQRLREARKKGQIARSKLFSSAAVTAGGLMGLVLGLSETAPDLRRWTAQVLSLGATTPARALSQAGTLLALMLAPALGGALLASLGVSIATAGLQVNVGHVAPQLERVDPFKGFKKLFNAQQLVELGKGLLVAAIITWVLWRGARDASGLLLTAPQRSGELAMLGVFAALKPVLLRAVVVLLALGAADYALARRRHLKDLMMSRDEMKREHKNQEGDPKHKAKRKALHQQLSAGGQARGVHKATAIVVNPTHIAIALRYDETECDAPYIVAKGTEEDALKIRKQARELSIPIVKDIPFARTLIHYDVGEEVPEELYQAAAAILKVALEKKGRSDGGTP